MQFDQILHLTAGAIERGVDFLGRLAENIGGDIAPIDAHRGRLDARDEETRGGPRRGGVAKFREAADLASILTYAFARAGVGGGDRIGGRLNTRFPDSVPSDTNHIFYSFFLLPFHCFWAAI